MATMAMNCSSAFGDAEIERYANADKFPELHMDDETRHEVKASWIMFVQQKGSVEEAANAIGGALQKANSPFAQLLYPDRINTRKSKGIEVDPNTGQRVNADVNRTYAQIMRAGSDSQNAGNGGGCPFAGNGGQGQGGGSNSMMSSLLNEDFDQKEFAEVMKKVFAATAAAKAAGQDITPGQAKLKAAAREQIASNAPTRAASNTPNAPKRAASRAKSPKEAGPKTKAATTAKTRALTPSGKSSAWSRKVSL